MIRLNYSRLILTMFVSSYSAKPAIIVNMLAAWKGVVLLDVVGINQSPNISLGSNIQSNQEIITIVVFKIIVGM